VIRRIGLLAMVALIAVMMMVATAAPAFAKLTTETTNPAGHITQGDAAGEPPQDTDVVNQGGNEPPGQNKGDAVAG
jgi:hypothetical protein